MRGLKKLSSSFKDPSGYVYQKKGEVYRAINSNYKRDYQLLKTSGLYKKLIEARLLIPHAEVKRINSQKYFKIIKPEVVPFISYPYEWCFSQLKAAALATLKIQKLALEHNMSLKDASAFNIQFVNNSPILIDTLSFKIYKEDEPWAAYRQFCTHFLAPLALMKYSDVHLNQLLRIFIDGIPLTATSSLLPVRSWLNFGIAVHIHTQAKLSAAQNNSLVGNRNHSLPKQSQIHIITNLENTVTKLNIKSSSFWEDYYSDNNYSKKAFDNKKEIVLNLVKKTKPRTVWDIGANTGAFSHLTAKAGFFTLSIDNDPISVEANYNLCLKKNIKKCYPLFIDVANPTPALGWNNKERDSLTNRGQADITLALALIHHLAIGKNMPFELQAQWFSKITNNLIVEFIPKLDSQVQRMLADREDIFQEYTKENFEMAFGKYFIIVNHTEIKGSLRSLYLMKNKRNFK